MPLVCFFGPLRSRWSGSFLLLAGIVALIPAGLVAAPATQPAESADRNSQQIPERLPPIHPGEGVAGTIEARTVEIRPEIDSAIQQVNCHDGQLVKRGDILFQLNDAAARAQVDASKAEFELADARARTYENVGPGVVSTVEKNVVMAQRRIAAANLVVKQAALDQTRLVAPIGGVVIHCDAIPGEVALRGVPLAAVVQVHPLFVRFSLHDGADRLHVGDWVGLYNLNSLKPLAAAKISYVSSEYDASAHPGVFKAEFDNTDDALKPGWKVNVLPINPPEPPANKP